MLQDNKHFLLLLTLFLGVIEMALTDEAVNPAQPRQCFSCEGINCQRISKQNVTTTCTDLLDICVTIFEDSTVVAKGCYLDMPVHYRNKCEHGNDPECFKCFGQRCNNKGRQDFSCIECNDNLNCAKDTTMMKPVQCPIPTAPNSYCYVRQLSENRVQRGCSIHVQDQMNCMKDSSCSLCLSSDIGVCNAYTIDTHGNVSKGSSALINTSLTLTLMFVIVGLLR